MNAPTRTSPLESALAALSPEWIALRGMRVPRAIPGEAAARAAVALADLSFLPRCGVKGPAAEDWLRARGVAPPATNQWAGISGGGLVARLGMSEFLLEDGPHGHVAAGLAARLAPEPGVVPVPRQDAALALAGPRLHELLAQTCSFDFKALPTGTPAVVMTSMAGVSVAAIAGTLDGQPLLRLWCDGTYGPYLWRALLDVASELGGGAAGVASLYPGWVADQSTAGERA